MKRSLALLAVCLLAVACSTSQPMPPRELTFEEQLASLQAIDGLVVTRTSADRIDVEVTDAISEQALADFASVFNIGNGRLLAIEGFGDSAFEMRDALLNLGVTSRITAHRNDELKRIVLHVQVV